MSRPGPTSMQKRAREAAKRAKKQRKAERREQRNELKAQRSAANQDGEDPDIAGIVAGPQPIR